MLPKSQPAATNRLRDRLIVFDKDQLTCEVIPLDEVNEEVVRAADRTVPRADLTLKLSKQGRIFVLHAPTEYIEHTQHLARVERNTIIRQIAQYKKPLEETKTDWFKYVMIGALVIVSIVAAAT